MMTKNHSHNRKQLEILTIDQLVLEDHLVRKLDSAIDFSASIPWLKTYIRGRSSKYRSSSFV
jgi:hypothetical protein